MVTLNMQDKWEDIIPEKKSVLEWAACVRGDLLVTCYMEDCVNKLYIHKLKTGVLVQEVSLPPGSVVGYSGRVQDSFVSSYIVFYQISSLKFYIITNRIPLQ